MDELLHGCQSENNTFYCMRAVSRHNLYFAPSLRYFFGMQALLSPHQLLPSQLKFVTWALLANTNMLSCRKFHGTKITEPRQI